MHIGFLTPEYPSLSKTYGGIGTSIKNLASVLISSGHDVSVFLYAQDTDEVIELDKIKFLKIKNENVKGLSWWFTRKKIEKLINKEVNKNGLDLVEGSDWTGMTAFMKIKCPVLLKLHGSDAYFCHIDGRKQKLKNFLFEKYALQSADAIVSVSQYTADLTKKLFNLKIPMKVIHNGIDPSVFSVASADALVNGRLLYFGTLIRKKGVLELPYIFNKVVEDYPNASLYLVGGDSFDISTGSSSTWELMKPLFSDKALKQTKYLGKVPHEQMQEHIKQAHVCVFPSYAEAFPISWLEAMACQKAIAGSNLGWAQEAIENKVSGLLASPSNHKEYANNIKRFLSDNKYTHIISEAARKRVIELFSADKIAKDTISYYEEVLR